MGIRQSQNNPASRSSSGWIHQHLQLSEPCQTSLRLRHNATRQSQSLSSAASAEALATATPIAISGELNGGSGLSRKASFGKRMMGSLPGRKGRGHHIRKARSAQLKLDLEDVSSGASLSQASSASLGFSFSFSFTGFTGLTAPSEDIKISLLTPKGSVMKRMLILRLDESAKG